MKVIIVTPQTHATEMLYSELNMRGFQCVFADDSNVMKKIRKNPSELLLVEFSDSPDMESLYLHLRQWSGLPVLALIPQEKLDRLNGYADDFIIVPFNITELQTRAKRLVNKQAEVSRHLIDINGLKIDLDKYEVFIEDRLILLTFKEYELLRFLASHPGKVFTRNALLNYVWGEDFFGGDRIVDVYIQHLRSKIGNESQSFIETIRNIGYRFINS